MKGMHRVRWPKDGEPEMQCARCYEFLPITAEFWRPEWGTQRCKACQDEVRKPRQRQAMRRKRAGDKEVARAYEADFYRRKYSTLARFRRRLGIAS